MEKPNIENYKLGKGFHTHDFVSDLILYSDQVEAEKKELSEKVAAKFYEIDFDGHVKAKIVISNGKIKIIAAMNGYGDIISVDKIDIKNLPSGE